MPKQEKHRCSGCGHRWEGELKGAELCGDCWRQAQPVVHGAYALSGATPAALCQCGHPRDAHGKTGTCLNRGRGEGITYDPCDCIGFTPVSPTAPERDLGCDTPWPLSSVLTRLSDAADHLLHGHDCDCQGHEGIKVAVDKAREYVKQLREASVSTPVDEGKIEAILRQSERQRIAAFLQDTQPQLAELIRRGEHWNEASVSPPSTAPEQENK